MHCQQVLLRWARHERMLCANVMLRYASQPKNSELAGGFLCEQHWKMFYGDDEPLPHRAALLPVGKVCSMPERQNMQ